MLTLSGAGQPQNGGGVEERFVITVKTDNAGGSADNQFIVPTRFGVYNYTIETSDGQTINNVTGDYTITFPTPGTYDILISGDFPWYRGRYSADKDKLIEVKNWGIIAWENFDGAFAGCNNLTVISATDVPDLSNVTNFGSMFYGINILEINNIENWDVSNVQLFNSMFYQSEVIRNPNIPIDLSGWDMSSATNISSMFQTLQQPTTLTFDLSNWDISNITNMADLFRLGGFDTVKKYDDTLISWSAGNPQSNIVINFGDNQYTYEAASARQTLIDTYGWTITDGGQVASPEFVISVKTDNTGTSNDDQFTVPAPSNGFNYTIQTSDGQTISNLTGPYTVTFPTAGEYDLKISGAFPRIIFRFQPDLLKLIKIKNWGILQPTSIGFGGCKNLTEVPTSSAPDLTNVTSLFELFFDCESLTSLDLNTWNTSTITSLGECFQDCNNLASLNINNWDVSNVTDMSELVENCNSLVSLDLSNWQTTSLVNLAEAFQSASGNINVSTWDVTNVTSISRCFRNSSVIVDVSGWDTSNISNMGFVFEGTNLSSYGIGNWNTSNVTTMIFMLRNADLFNESLSSWDISNVTNFTSFMNGSDGMSTANYDATLISWANQTPQLNITIDFGGSQYTLGGAAEAARNTLINTYGWTITDGGGIFVGLLDTYPNASAAYSLRDLASASVGSAVVRVRRSSDNTEQDFTAAEITDGTLTTFTGANDGFVTTWYDQSGNGYDLIQNSALNQPKLVVNGVVNTYLSKPSILADGSDYLIESTNNRTAFSFAHNSSASLSYVSNLNGGIWFGTSSAAYGNTGNQGFEIGVNVFNAEVAVRNNGVMRVKDNIDNTEWNSGGIYYSEWDVSVVDVNSRSDNYKNNTSLTVSHNGSATSPIFEAASEKELAFFAKSYGTSYSNGNFSEMIIWQGLQTSNREGIYNDTNNYY